MNQRPNCIPIAPEFLPSGEKPSDRPQRPEKEIPIRRLERSSKTLSLDNNILKHNPQMLLPLALLLPRLAEDGGQQGFDLSVSLGAVIFDHGREIGFAPGEDTDYFILVEL